MKVKEYVIKEGKHRSGIYFHPHINTKLLHYEVLFHKDCLYDLESPDQLDVNKLFGLSFGHHHNNSARFGWRAVKGQIELLAYVYDNKKRIIESLGFYEINQLYNLKLIITKDKYIFKIYNTGTLLENVSISKNTNKNYGYFLYPYFGGDRTAPHTMRILLCKMKLKSFIQTTIVFD